MNNEQKSLYLSMADETDHPEDKLYYRMMAEIAPTVSTMAAAHINHVGAQMFYNAVVQVAAAIVFEVAYNVGDVENKNNQKLIVSDFRRVLKDHADKFIDRGSIPCSAPLNS
jgi:hypothetical protein